MHEFSYATIGGLLIGFSAALMMLLLGRISGISGIFWRSLLKLTGQCKDEGLWPLTFIVGLPLGAFISHQFLSIPEPTFVHAPYALVIIAGLLVGFGTRLGTGCTSGHGICGIGRLSLRSIVATVTFMVSAIITVFISQQIL